MKHPDKLTELVRENDTAYLDGTITHPTQYNQATKLPYLKAVIQESLRLCPPFAVPMPRYVPTGGLQLSGHHIPAGFKVRNRACLSYHKTANVNKGRYECDGHAIR
jgi:cytochrome P450